jgi:hypothetical protein
MAVVFNASFRQINGVAVAGFFVTKGMGGHLNRPAYSADRMTQPFDQDDDLIFQQYKALAKDQTWTAKLGALIR